MNSNLQKIIDRYNQLEKDIADPIISSNPENISKIFQEKSDLEPKVNKIKGYFDIEKKLAENRQILQEDDQELKEIAQSEIDDSMKKKEILEKDIEYILLPQDPDDQKNVIVEIRPAAGGDESELFASEILRMYLRYAERQEMKTAILTQQQTGISGVKYVAFEVTGKNVYSLLKYESGVHRVQRVPKTESKGRVHTSTVTVAVLPEAEDKDIEIKSEELRIDVFRSSGPGGQSVNTTDSAVRVTHLPTNTVITCQDEKSQHKNKAKVLSILRSRLLQAKEETKNKQRGKERKSQIGTGDRSEKIRTYNFPQDRVTDHRINQSWHNLPRIMDGEIAPIIKVLKEEDKKRILESSHESVGNN